MSSKLKEPLPVEPLVYSVREACQVSRIGRTTLYKLMSEGKIEARKVGKRRLIVAASLRALFEGDDTKPPWSDD